MGATVVESAYVGIRVFQPNNEPLHYSIGPYKCKSTIYAITKSHRELEKEISWCFLSDSHFGLELPCLLLYKAPPACFLSNSF